jgi:hypothetical protein
MNITLLLFIIIIIIILLKAQYNAYDIWVLLEVLSRIFFSSNLEVTNFHWKLSLD